LERNLEKQAFWTFLEHKSEENGKVSNFLVGTVPDGVKPLHMTALRVTKEVEVENTRDDPEYFLSLGPDGVTKAVRVQLHMTALRLVLRNMTRHPFNCNKLINQ
jgi:hypothetical protein